jgi:uncharacterized membrane protein YkvA (DUF1232 family)
MIKREIVVYQAVLRDARTPWAARILLAAGIGYFFLPFDLIPDWIPILGQLDDLIIVPALIASGLALAPREIVAEHRQRINAERNLHA